ncbi:uncharacterized protein MYCGRDRAFT_34343 [Zymoseptoria tritici IPO323]|uniref:Ribosomal RNA-processing protein 42 n=1 Tax=Zymoseptoria tritici (strain CBS 115943 / IPO323) TaxID=336722 RepID=F9X1B2_ZYMTI|nr:uncharacterized protein MYCGRDRAFT_34343 [Zymoseptoria tritici IPO323]EGP91555.1 hypothetical protein MYCGRDRAFT_34343 [Zymoseptoria tritici IPO323]
MAPFTNIPLSPAELSYLHTSLLQNPPIRPDGRSPTDFRPLVAETDILPSTNGSARVCFADGTEAIVGVKAEVEKSVKRGGTLDGEKEDALNDVDMDDEDEGRSQGKGQHSWLEINIEIPGMRDDDALPVFLAAMLTEALLADGSVKDRLWINSRFHWRLYIDILLLSPPLSYPLPLLSLTTHLALISTRLPSLISERDEDPLFNDDWEASTHLFPPTSPSKPPVTLLVMTVGSNIFFDPSSSELAVAEGVLAVSVSGSSEEGGKDGKLNLVALRMVDPPSRLTAAGVPNGANSTEGGFSAKQALELRERDAGVTVWRPPRGGVGRGVVREVVEMVVGKGGVGREVLKGLEGVEV